MNNNVGLWALAPQPPQLPTYEEFVCNSLVRVNHIRDIPRDHRECPICRAGFDTLPEFAEDTALKRLANLPSGIPESPDHVLDLLDQLPYREPRESNHPVRLPCGHFFGDGCIMQWFRTSPTCPLCRARHFIMPHPSLYARDVIRQWWEAFYGWRTISIHRILKMPLERALTFQVDAFRMIPSSVICLDQLMARRSRPPVKITWSQEEAFELKARQEFRERGPGANQSWIPRRPWAVAHTAFTIQLLRDAEAYIDTYHGLRFSPQIFCSDLIRWLRNFTNAFHRPRNEQQLIEQFAHYLTMRAYLWPVSLHAELSEIYTSLREAGNVPTDINLQIHNEVDRAFVNGE